MRVSRDGVGSWIEQEILRGDLPPGAKLPPERELATRFGVSRPIVREALRGLAERGFIEIAPGRGAFARHAQASDAARPLDLLYRRQNSTPRMVIEARMMLEREAAMLAAQRATSEELDAMGNAIGRFDAAAGLIEKARWDVTFHALLAKMAHNQVIETMFHSIVGLTLELILRSLADPVVTAEGVPYHAMIHSALCDRDPVRACAAVESHLSVAAHTYGADLDQSLDTVARRELERFLGPSVSLEHILQTVTAEVVRASAGGEAVEGDQ